MKFITYMYKNKESIGFIEEDRVYKIEKKNMIELIKSYSNTDFEIIRKNDNSLLLREVVIKAPIIKPIHDIICVGKNYKDHILELGNAIEEDFVASYFGKRATRIIGLNENIKGRFDLDESIDYEVELAVIIGEKCKNVSKENALSCIFGYTIFNDITARNIQMAHGQWYRGKSLDDYTSMGPYIVTKDELNANNLFIRSYVNGELRQNSNTKDMIIKIEEIIEELSSGMTLEPGDIIGTGTPGGVGLGFNPPKLLKKGDKISCEVEGLGCLENYIC